MSVPPPSSKGQLDQSLVTNLTATAALMQSNEFMTADSPVPSKSQQDSECGTFKFFSSEHSQVEINRISPEKDLQSTSQQQLGGRTPKRKHSFQKPTDNGNRATPKNTKFRGILVKESSTQPFPVLCEASDDDSNEETPKKITLDYLFELLSRRRFGDIKKSHKIQYVSPETHDLVNVSPKEAIDQALYGNGYFEVVVSRLSSSVSNNRNNVECPQVQTRTRPDRQEVCAQVEEGPEQLG